MKLVIALTLLLIGITTRAAEVSGVLYTNNFEQAKVGSVPDDLLVLDGGFTVQEEDGNKFLELPGAPLETWGVLFGPSEKAHVRVSARILGTAKGRRAPSFGVGLCGAGGYRLLLSPAKKQLEIFKGDEARVQIPIEWESGKWMSFTLEILKDNDSWRVLGKVWNETLSAVISCDEKEEPNQGKASIWGNPFSGTPIRYDDLSVLSLKP